MIIAVIVITGLIVYVLLFLWRMGDAIDKYEECVGTGDYYENDLAEMELSHIIRLEKGRKINFHQVSLNWLEKLTGIIPAGWWINA